MGGFLDFLDKYLFNAKWTCSVCGKDVFDDKYFCDDCLKTLPFNGKNICNHCGRKTHFPQEYCNSCANFYLSVDTARSVFNYEMPIKSLIKRLKYKNAKYISEIFAPYLKEVYENNKFDADIVAYAPMSNKAKKARGYNQAELIAKGFAKEMSLEVFDGLLKIKETKRQAGLTKFERTLNLQGAFKIENKKEIKDKIVVLIDDVLTTGNTTEMLSALLKKAGAKKVIVLTVASVQDEFNFF